MGVHFPLSLLTLYFLLRAPRLHYKVGGLSVCICVQIRLHPDPFANIEPDRNVTGAFFASGGDDPGDRIPAGGPEHGRSQSIGYMRDRDFGRRKKSDEKIVQEFFITFLLLFLLFWSLFFFRAKTSHTKNRQGLSPECLVRMFCGNHPGDALT